MKTNNVTKPLTQGLKNHMDGWRSKWKERNGMKIKNHVDNTNAVDIN